MKVIIPLKGLTSDEDFLLNDIQFISNFNSEQYLNTIRICENHEKNRNTLLTSFVGFDLDWYYGKTLAILDVNELNEEEFISNHDQMIIISQSLTEKVNRTLDIIRVYQCNLTEQEKLPSYPGICTDGFSSILLLNEQSEYIPFVYRVQNLSFVEGLGLYLDNIIRYEQDPLYNVLYKEEQSYISNIVQLAIKRLNEAMYIPDPNTQFVYLMSTLEVICSQQYIPFSEVRKRIAVVVCEDRKSYDLMGDKLRDLSEVYRTNIVHNGVDMFKNEFEIMKRNLLFLQSLIVGYVTDLVENGKRSEEEYLAFLENKKLQLKIDSGKKLDQNQLVEKILSKYEGDTITFNYEEWSEILNNSKKNFLEQILNGETLLKL